jgi:hypothetical protein
VLEDDGYVSVRRKSSVLEYDLIWQRIYTTSASSFLLKKVNKQKKNKQLTPRTFHLNSFFHVKVSELKSKLKSTLIEHKFLYSYHSIQCLQQNDDLWKT